MQIHEVEEGEGGVALQVHSPFSPGGKSCGEEEEEEEKEKRDEKGSMRMTVGGEMGAHRWVGIGRTKGWRW